METMHCFKKKVLELGRGRSNKLTSGRGCMQNNTLHLESRCFITSYETPCLKKRNDVKANVDIKTNKKKISHT